MQPTRQLFTGEMVADILSRYREQDQAAVFEGSTQRPFEIQVHDIDLSSAPSGGWKTLKGPIRSVFVRTATDSTTSVAMAPNTRDSFQGQVTLKLNDSCVFPEALAEINLSWTAQAGKTMQIVTFATGEYRSGSQVSTTAGGVSISEGDTVTSIAGASVGLAAASLFASDSTRKLMVIQNQSGQSIWLGDAAVTLPGGTKPGIELTPGATYEWRSTAACFAITGGVATAATAISLTKFN